jgi:UDP-GlcNAc:undecaprenyl-phosphate/decaprenyl-phosphate GlcNAc-1-phosphate transferase
LPDELRALLAFDVAFVVVLVAVPWAIRLAHRLDCLDRPAGYKVHGRATPCLGGLAVLAGFLPAAAAFGAGGADYLVIVLGAIGLFAVGTVDDRMGLGPLVRVLAEALAALALWEAGLGWAVFHADALNLLLTVAWVVGLVNAFNLMDNQDGALGTIGLVCAAGAAVAAGIAGNAALAALGLALGGACAGFLPYNLAKPSRLFLGDGGSMPIGFVLAAVVMAAPADVGLSATAILVAAPLVGLPILDTTLVVFSRIRRGATVLSGGHDHLTHRLLGPLGSPRAVALVLGSAQAALCGLGLVLFDAAHPTIMLAAMGYVITGAVVIMVLDWPDAASQAPAPGLAAPARQETIP